jgi:hypothetical protein
MQLESLLVVDRNGLIGFVNAYTYSLLAQWSGQKFSGGLLYLVFKSKAESRSRLLFRLSHLRKTLFGMPIGHLEGNTAQ